MQNPTDRNTYFSSMSQAMAEMCDIFATVMTKDLNDVPTDGIWSRVEFPTLQRSDNQGKVYTIDICNPDASQVKNYWSRLSSRFLVRRNPQSVYLPDLVDESGGGCGAENGAEADFDQGTEFEVIW